MFSYLLQHHVTWFVCTYSCGAVFLGNVRRASLLKYHVSVTPEFDTPSVCTTEIVDMECEKVDLCKKNKKAIE